MTQETWEEYLVERLKDCKEEDIGLVIGKISQQIQKAREEEREKLPEILTKYSEYLSEHGYMDSDWYCEEPNTVEDFLKDKPRR